jgi:hypothetical protein
LEEHDILTSDISWYNILGKGYKVLVATWQAGGQLVLQPSFSTAHEKFNLFQSLYSAAVATDWPANKRAVYISKSSNLLSHGLECHESQH